MILNKWIIQRSSFDVNIQSQKNVARTSQTEIKINKSIKTKTQTEKWSTYQTNIETEKK